MTQNIKFRLEDIIKGIVWKYLIYTIIQLMLCDIPRYLYCGEYPTCCETKLLCIKF